MTGNEFNECSIPTILVSSVHQRAGSSHPCYLSALIGITGLALVVNYLGIYLMTALLYPVIYAVVLLEEYELVTRFGEQYRKYQRRVPRMVPRHR